MFTLFLSLSLFLSLFSVDVRVSQEMFLINTYKKKEHEGKKREWRRHDVSTNDVVYFLSLSLSPFLLSFYQIGFFLSILFIYIYLSSRQ